MTTILDALFVLIVSAGILSAFVFLVSAGLLALAVMREGLQE